MCGIVGLLDFGGKVVDLNSLWRMTNSLSHRGPDDAGMHLISFNRRLTREVKLFPPFQAAEGFECAFGFRRLSILDVSSAGHQPMVHPSGDLVIVFNGEIYNAGDYRQELINDGVSLRGHSDTEILIHLFYKYGMPSVLERLNGMFAFAVCDLRNGALYLARDRVGIKPLYWTYVDNKFMFASEMKAFLFHPSFEPNVREESIDEYLSYRYCAGDRTLLKGVYQVQPGQWLRVLPNHISTHVYWEVPDETEKRLISAEQASEELNELLKDSVKLQLLSDVKVGCQLSGGIDSSLIAAFSKFHMNADFDTFSVVFSNASFTEDRWISEVTTKLETDSHRFPFQSSYFVRNLEIAAWFMDQPFNLPNSLGIYLLAEKSKPTVTVLLSGEGADELFGGYTRFYFANVRSQIRPLLPIARRFPIVGKAFVNAFNDPSDTDPGLWFVKHGAFMDAERVKQIRPTSEPGEAIGQRYQEYQLSRGGSIVDRCLKYELRTYMVDLLMRQDRMTMAHSVENRVPFLDHRIVEFVRSLPTHLLVGKGIYRKDVLMRNTKMLLKQVAGKYFSHSFIYRKKCGFSMPLEQYFQDKEFIALMEDRLIPGIHKRGWVKADLVEQWWRQASKEKESNFLIMEQIWSLVSLELWAQQFIDRITPSGLGAGRLSGP